jgi:hypothetical protein
VPLRHDHRKLGAGFVTLPQMTGRRVGMPFILSPPTLALRFRQNSASTPSAVALSFCRLLGLGCPKQAFAKIATPRLLHALGFFLDIWGTMINTDF